MSYDIANPDPAGTITSLRSFGYSVEAAVADLVDNSVSAGARRIDVYFTWAGAASWVAVVDDGRGMTADELVTAMTVAAKGSYQARAAADLGRFGMGLKSASFSQAARLTVSTRTAVSAEEAVRTWDLSVVAETSEWRLLHGTDEETGTLLKQLRPHGGAGTTVVWRDLHRFAMDGVTAEDARAQKQFYAEATRVEEHLGMVFGRFLVGRNRLAMTVNATPVKAWDPFLSGHPSVQRLPAEELPVGNHTVRIEPFILPHPKKLSPEQQQQAAGPGGWLDQQGFYVYRRDRLILAGDWLGIRGFRRDERYNLARIIVDVPAEADADWAIDVRKSTAVPPVGARRHLQRIGTATRSRAAEVLSHRGRIAAREHGAEFIYAWRVDKRDGTIRCRINRDHPLVREVLQGGPDAAVDAKALIRLLEETVPVAALRIMHDGDVTDDPEPFLGAAPKEVGDVANRIYAAFVAQGRTPREAKERLALMPPFDQFDGFWQQR
ncbi:Histidine kinase-, DNA gyrase B-, and HSP90-like ATPase [Micromonospora citrea]|uniref:Histidine kinase-, DNA gyrase B-, and HSP90-like ATPase n=1 Tax=Micromonospora citrea TaxID=47855 RepID=A0A1C6UHY7_9ACTN|nr:ATP-binding protein [Micromonospora citrea]SCL53591.1 Histidine kinase-, DNA gyrase B-, and HSP90-like ATPase [Micromonospora citrea]